MKKFIYGAVSVLLLFLIYEFWDSKISERNSLEESSALIQQQIKNVGKLIVTEGTFSQVYTYKDSRNFYLDVLSAEKKALIIVNAKATVAYDLSKLEVEIDEEERKVIITKIPEEEISIYPDIQYYDVSQDYLNQFKAEDYNTVKRKVSKSIRQKVEKSALKTNAENRLISELQKIFILTSTLGWTLEYKDQEFKESEALEKLKL